MTMTRLYLDCDGVLADFERGATEVFGMPLQEYERRHGLGGFWKALARAPDFYARLPLMTDAMELFDAVRHLDPVILTGCQRGGWEEAEKERWAAANFPGTRLIPCMAVEQRRPCRRSATLLADTMKHRHLGAEAGGGR